MDTRVYRQEPDTPDHLAVDEHGRKYAGRHVLFDYYGVKPYLLDDPARIEEVLRKAAQAAGATVLGANFHHFGDGHGVTGTLILAESHITVHTWPEYGFVAIDAFLCGKCDPWACRPFLIEGFRPERMEETENRRGTKLKAP